MICRDLSTIDPWPFASDQKSMPLTLPCVNHIDRWCGWSRFSPGTSGTIG